MCIMAPQSKKLKGSFTYQATFNNAWFHKGDYKGVITNTERDTYGAYCFVYRKSVSTAHQGEKDLNLLSASPAKWPNTLKQFVGCSRPIV